LKSSLLPTISSDFLTLAGNIGRKGGTLVISQHSEPKTLNPLIAIDSASKTIIGLITADLIHINRATQRTEPALAKSWEISADGRVYTLYLRQGLRFSDGSPFDADDVVFTWDSYLDKTVNSPQRDLLLVSGKPIQVRKLDRYTVEFTLSCRYAAAERLFDSIAILPRHLLQESSSKGTLAKIWGLNTAPAEVAGLGPFRFKAYIPGQRIILERNPYYWKRDSHGTPLPYLEGIVSVFTATADAEALRFDAGDTDIISRLSAADFLVLQKNEARRHFQLYDLGPGLEYDFLFFNENTIPPGAAPSLAVPQSWFRQVAFRKAISSVIDRSDIVRLAYGSKALPLSIPVTPGNKFWVNDRIGPPEHSLVEARRLLHSCGFSWTPKGSLMDPKGRPVGFSIMVNAGNPQQIQMAVLIQQDLKDLGIEVSLEQLELRTILNRIVTTLKYEAAILGLVDGDADPNSELNVLTSTGSAHFWRLKSDTSPEPWQKEIDTLMEEQLTAPDYQTRKRIYDRVQTFLCEYVPVIYLVTPDIIVGAKDQVGNFRPVILANYTLWNAEQLFLRY
jgi:peptide/nickel transport system substrate-binding protein